MDTSRLQTTHDAQREARHALYDQELSALQAQKSMLIDRLEEAQSEIDQTRETNHSKLYINSRSVFSYINTYSDLEASPW